MNALDGERGKIHQRIEQPARIGREHHAWQLAIEACRHQPDKRLIDLLSAEKCACATDWTGCVNAAVRAFADGQPQFDDVTCLAIAHA